MITVAPLRAGEMPAARELLTSALQDDPGWVHVLPDRSRPVALRTVLSIALRDAQPFGSVLGAYEGNTLAGVAVWYSPGRYPMSWRRQLRATPSMAVLPIRIGVRNMRALTAFGMSTQKAFPSNTPWYLVAVGAHPAMRRRGVGAALMRPVLETADAEAVSCYLETAKPENVPYYERFGFDVMPPAGPLYEGGPTMWRMMRPPQPTSPP